MNCIWKSGGETPEETKHKDNWYRFSRDLSPEEQKVFEEWAKKYGVTGEARHEPVTAVEGRRLSTRMYIR